MVSCFYMFLTKCLHAQVSDIYRRPNLEPTNPKCSLEEVSHTLDNQGIQMLGQIKHGSCHSRAILFKVLADTVGLDSRLVVVGLLLCHWKLLHGNTSFFFPFFFGCYFDFAPHFICVILPSFYNHYTSLRGSQRIT